MNSWPTSNASASISTNFVPHSGHPFSPYTNRRASAESPASISPALSCESPSLDLLIPLCWEIFPETEPCRFPKPPSTPNKRNAQRPSCALNLGHAGRRISLFPSHRYLLPPLPSPVEVWHLQGTQFEGIRDNAMDQLRLSDLWRRVLNLDQSLHDAPFPVRVIGALSLLFIAWILAGWASRLTYRSLQKAKIDETLSRFATKF